MEHGSSDNSSLPTSSSTAVFRVKAMLLQTRRGIFDIAQGIRRHGADDPTAYPFLLAESRSPLWSDGEVAELPLERGKVHNLRRSVVRLRNVAVPANAVFSFWKQIGCATKGRGFVEGRLLREGCLIPAVGGGLCQLSNALYQAALSAGCKIVERHPHSRVVPGSAAEFNRDATVAWNYIDLRFQPSEPVLIRASLTADELVVSIHAKTQPRIRRMPLNPPVERPKVDPKAHSCITCGVDDCSQRRTPLMRVGDRDVTAYLLDEYWPEYQAYVESCKKPQDVIAIPVDGIRHNWPAYRWITDGFAVTRTATWQTLMRSAASRRLGEYGAKRLAAQITASAAIAERLTSILNVDTVEVCVSQSLLPYLWESGHLGGRPFDVLMTRLPLTVLHERLDDALKRYPNRATLGEYRADPAVVRAETEALAAARAVVTPHRDIAALFPRRFVLLDWRVPEQNRQGRRHRVADPPHRVAFAGPTAARKGAFELRKVAKSLDLEVSLRGSDLEGDDFWNGVRTVRLGDRWLDGCFVVVQPSLVEDKPRALLAALADNVPVITTAASGLEGCENVTVVPWGDMDALTEAVKSAQAAFASVGPGSL